MPVINDLNSHGQRLSDAEASQLAAAQEGQFSRGLRSGAYSAAGQLNTLAGETAQRLGATDFAQGRFSAAKDYMAQAAEAAPRVGSMRDIHGVRDAIDYGAGLFGQAVPMVAGGVAATALTRGRAIPGILANTALMAPMEAGDVLQRQAAEGQPTNLRNALGAGVLSAAGQAVIPGMAGARMTGKMASRGMGELATIPEQALAGGAAEALKQGVAGQNFDPMAVADATAGGAVVGAPFAAMGAMGRRASQKAPGAPEIAPGGTQAPTEPGKGPGGAPDAPAGPSETAFKGLQGAMEGAKTRAADAAQRVADGLPADLGAFAKDFNPATPEGRAAVAKAYDETSAKVKEWGDDLLKRNLKPETHEALTKAMGDLSSEANRAFVATTKLAEDAAKGTMDALDRAHTYFRKRAGGDGKAGDVVDVDATEAKPSTPASRRLANESKKSEDYSGYDSKVVEALRPMLTKAKPELLQSNDSINKVASLLRNYMEQVAKKGPGAMKSDDIAHLIDVFGEHTTEVLTTMHDAVKSGDRAEAENFFGSLNQLEAGAKEDRSTLEMIRKGLKHEHRGLDARELHNHLSQWVRRPADRSQSTVFHDNKINQLIDTVFEKPDQIRAMLERDAAPMKLQADKERAGPKSSDDATEQDFDNRLSDGNAKLTRLHDDALDSPDAHRAQYGNEGKAERLIREAKERDPESDRTNYRWMHASEYQKLMGDVPDTDGLTKTKGYVVAERMEGSDKWTESTFNRFKFDTKKGDRRTDPSAINVGTKDAPVYVDAMKLAHGGKSADESIKAGDNTSLERMARRFMNNVAALTDYLGRAPRFSESTVVARFTNPDTKVVIREITAGELKRHLSERASSDPSYQKRAAQQDQLIALRQEWRDADPERRKEISKEAGRITNDMDFAVAKDQVARDDEPFVEGSGIPSMDKVRRREIEAQALALEKRGDMVGAQQFRNMLAGENMPGVDLHSGGTRSGDLRDGAGSASLGSRMRMLGKRIDAAQAALDVMTGDTPAARAKIRELQAWVDDANVRHDAMSKKGRMTNSPDDDAGRLEFDPAGQIHTSLKEAGGRDEPIFPNARGDFDSSTSTKLTRNFNEDGTPIIDRKRNSSPVELMARERQRTKSGNPALPENKAKVGDKFDSRTGERMSPDEVPRKSINERKAEREDQQSFNLELDQQMDDRAIWQKQVTWVERNFSKPLAEAKAIIDKLNQTQLDALVNHLEDTPGLPNGVKAAAYVQLRNHASDRSYNQEAPPDPKAVAAKKAAFLEKARSGDADLIKTLASSDDAKGLQRAAESLKGVKGEGAQRTIDAINTRLGELVRDEDTRYSMLRSNQYASPNGFNTSKERARVEQHIDKVLGGRVKTEWAAITHAGDFTRLSTGDVIRVSVHALNPMSVAFHESLHGFFAKLGDTQNDSVKRVLMRAADTSIVRRQLEKLLAAHPDALKQLSDPEERAAYMYQFWQTRDANGKRMLNVGPETTGVLGKIAKFFRSLMGVWTNDERALHIMDHFSRGEYAGIMDSRYDVHAAYMLPGRNRALETAASMTKPMTRMADEIATAGSAKLRDSNIPALRELADKMKASNRDADSGATDPGFIPAARIERTRVMNSLGKELSRYSKEQISMALEAMQSGTKATDTGAKIIQRLIQDQKVGLLANMKRYMEKAGVDVSDLGPDYFPRVYSPDYISRHQTEFIALLEKHAVADPVSVMNKIMGVDGNEFGIEVARPGMQHLKLRKLAHIPDAELAKFMSKDAFHILNSYVTQATRRAEWAKRFGDDGAGLHDIMKRAKLEGADDATIDYANKFVMGVDGTLGDTINPTARRLMGDMIVYQNLRLLPLAIFSSVVDPVGIVVRGGTVGDAWTTFKRGVSEVRKNFQDKPGKDASTELAETLGVIDNAALVHSLGALYSQGMVGDTGRKINDTFFKYNLMEQFNMSMRVGAMEAAVKFIGRHGDGSADVHSERWIAELGLKKGDVVLDVDGRPKLSEAQGLSPEQAARMRTAVNRWVDGAVLRPDAVDKPVWMNDPHFALVSHLKQFVYSFNETILKRIGHEAEHGNYRPVMALASYVPIMIASDMVKGLIQGGGQQPEWKDDWGASDYVWSGVQRAGLLGVGQFAVDTGTHAFSLAGPTGEQLVDAVKTLGGREQFNHFAIKSLPANALYAHAVGGQATDLAFTD